MVEVRFRVFREELRGVSGDKSLRLWGKGLEGTGAGLRARCVMVFAEEGANIMSAPEAETRTH